MSICPVCGKRTAKLKCTGCGFDASRDYEGFPTLAVLPAKLPSRKDFLRKYLAQTRQIVPADPALNKDIPRQQAEPVPQEKKDVPAANANHQTTVTSGPEQKRKPQTEMETDSRNSTGTTEHKPGWKLPALAAAVLVAAGILFFSLSGGEKDPCAKGHSWNPADCDSPRICKICGETAGTALGHSWRAADCDSPRTCKNCGETQGSALGHDWTAADCDSPKTCQACGETQGSALGHNWKDATTTAPETCSRCGATRGDRLSVSNEFASCNIDDHIFFGSYEQDGSRGNGSEPIEWVVLDKEDDRILVVALRALDCQQYHSTSASVTWETCDLRQWLNSDFYEAAFTEEEQKLILLSTVTADPNPYQRTDPGNNTTDYVFLLSYSEVTKYYTNKENRCQATPYAKSQGSLQASNSYTWWFLRTPGKAADFAARIDENGYIGNAKVERVDGSVRPAIWIRTTS